MTKRIIFALILIPIVIFLISTDITWVFCIAILLAGILLSNEVFNFNSKSITSTHRAIVYFSIFILVFVKYMIIEYNWSYGVIVYSLYFILFFLVFGLSIKEILLKDHSLSIYSFSISLFNFFYFGLVFTTMIDIRFFPDLYTENLINISSLGTLYLSYIFTISWMYDAGGYFIGRVWGHKKIGLSASPNKSWMGVLGGLGFSVIGYFLWFHILEFIYPEISKFSIFYENHIFGVIFSLLFSIVSQTGDLIESVFKRSAVIKDSSDLIPGHGGLYDAIDGTIPCALFLYLTINFSGFLKTF